MTYPQRERDQNFLPQQAQFSLELDNQYFQLQQALNELNYQEYLGVDSVPLVHSIFSDLVDITRNYQEVKSSFEKTQQQLDVTQNQIQPLQKDNDRLTRTNKSLRLDILKAQAKHEEAARSNAGELQKLQNSVSDVKFLLSQKINKVKAQEFDIIHLKRKLDTFLQRDGVFKSGESRGKKYRKAAPKQTKDLKTPLDMLRVKHRPKEHIEPRPSVDTFEILEKSAAQMRTQLVALKSKEKTWDVEVAKFQKTISEHQSEIERLKGRLTNSGSSGDLKEDSPDQRTIVKQLNLQVDILNAEMAELEKNLDHEKMKNTSVNKILQEKEDLATKNDRLMNEMSDLQERLKKLTEELSSIRSEKDSDLRNIEIATNEATRQSEENLITLRIVESERDRLRLENERLLEEKQDVTKSYDTYRNEKKTLSDILDKKDRSEVALQEKFKQLAEEHGCAVGDLGSLEKQLKTVQDKNASLVLDLSSRQDSLSSLENNRMKLESIIERLEMKLREQEKSIEARNSDNEHLKTELSKYSEQIGDYANTIERLNSTKHGLKKDTDAMSVDNEQLQICVQSLENDRDYYKKEYEQLSDLFRDENHVSARASSRIKRLETELEQMKDAYDVAQKERKSLLQEMSIKNANIRSLESELQDALRQTARLESAVAEMGSYKRETNQIREGANELEVDYRRITRDYEELQLKHEQLKKLIGSLQEDVGLIKNERDHMSGIIQNFDTKFLELQGKAKSVTDDRDNLEIRYKQLSAEFSARMDANVQVDRQRDENERIKKDLQRQTIDLERQLSELREVSNVRGGELAASMTKIEVLQKERRDLQEKLMKHQQEHQSLCDRYETLEHEKSNILSENHSLSLQVEKLQRGVDVERQNVRDQISQVCELKTLCQQIDHSRATAEQRLKEAVSQRESSYSKQGEFEDAYSTSLQQLKKKDEEISNLKDMLNTLVVEKDKMQDLVDEKAEKVAFLSDANSAEQAQKKDMETNAQQLQQRVESQSAQLDGKDRELGELQQETKELQMICEQLRQETRLKYEQCKSLSDDLGNMTKENEFVNGSLAKTVSDRDGKSQDLEVLRAKLNFLEDKLLAKEKEFADLMGNYRQLSQENERCKIAAQELEKERGEHRSEIQLLNEHLEGRDMHLNSLAEENKRFRTDIQAFEQQNNQLSRSIAALQSQVEAVQAEKESIFHDLSASRNVSTSLNQGKEDLETQIAELRTNNQMCEQQVNERIAECEARKQHAAELKAHYDELEELLSGMRMNEHQNSMTCNQLQQQCKQLKAHIPELTSRNKQLEKEIISLHQHRERQHKEVSRLTTALASGGLSRDELVQEFQRKVDDLQCIVKSKDSQISSMEDERSRMKDFLFQYETEIVRKERKINALRNNQSLSASLRSNK